MKRCISIKVAPDATKTLKSQEFNSAPIEDDDGNVIGGIIYRAQQRGPSTLILECEVGEDGEETVNQSFAVVGRAVAIEFEPDDPEEDEESDGFDLFFPPSDLEALDD